MELALITAQQVAVLFLLIGTGMVAVKTGVLKLENKQALSNLLVYIIVPAMVVNSYRMEFSAQILHNLLAAFGMSVLSVLLGTVSTLLLTARKTGSRMPIFRFACIFSNAAYMGFPLISALFGSEGLLYASAYVTVFNILLWTLGYGLVSGGSSVKEVARSLVRTPVLYAIVVGLGIYLLQIPLPALITQPLELLAGVNTPLSMLITGMLIAAGDVRSIVPAATLALFGVLGFHGTAAQVVTLLECCPAAAITSVFAVQFGHDEHFAAGSVVLTTLLSIVTLPLCALIITMVM
ncbi:MAG: AEC family transporter [Faecalibacterium prausnitzii]|nr:AEC family transporter [Faecalibacterium prausnitzii]